MKERISLSRNALYCYIDIFVMVKNMTKFNGELANEVGFVLVLLWFSLNLSMIVHLFTIKCKQCVIVHCRGNCAIFI